MNMSQDSDQDSSTKNGWGTSFRESISKSPVVWYLGTIAVVFGLGFGAAISISELQHSPEKALDRQDIPMVLKDQIDHLTNDH